MSWSEFAVAAWDVLYTMTPFVVFALMIWATVSALLFVRLPLISRLVWVAFIVLVPFFGPVTWFVWKARTQADGVPGKTALG